MIISYLQAQHLDIIGFNRYNAWYSLPGHTEIIRVRLEDEVIKWHKKHNKPVFMTEYGADSYAGLHMVFYTIVHKFIFKKFVFFFNDKLLFVSIVDLESFVRLVRRISSGIDVRTLQSI